MSLPFIHVYKKLAHIFFIKNAVVNLGEKGFLVTSSRWQKLLILTDQNCFMCFLINNVKFSTILIVCIYSRHVMTELSLSTHLQLSCSTDTADKYWKQNVYVIH